jgi:hypothetical protein
MTSTPTITICYGGPFDGFETPFPEKPKARIKVGDPLRWAWYRWHAGRDEYVWEPMFVREMGE